MGAHMECLNSSSKCVNSYGNWCMHVETVSLGTHAWPRTQPPMQNALEELRFYCTKDEVHVLGTYPASPERS